MKDWLGRTWDFLVQGVGGLIVRQRWVDYKQWGDFEGSWIPKSDYKPIDLYEEIRNPIYKFFWWWLRYVVFIVGKISGVVKVVSVGIVRGVYSLVILVVIKPSGLCLMRVIYRLRSLGSIKVLGQGLGSLKFWIIPKENLKVLGQSLAIIRILLQILGIEKVLGICSIIIRIILQASGNVKIQGASCVTEYVSWQHFGTWQDWANATGGKWYYMC
jgi:hypothetical protein